MPTSTTARCLLFFIYLLFLNFFINWQFLRTNISAEQSWRQTDVQAEISFYAHSQTNFIHPMVNAPLTQWGPGLMEIGLPLYQYISAFITSKIGPLLEPLLTQSKSGMITAPYATKISKLNEIASHSKYRLEFDLKPKLEFRLSSFISPRSKSMLHLYLTEKDPSSRKNCILVQINQHNPFKYCYSSLNTPIVKIPVKLGENAILFTNTQNVDKAEFKPSIILFSDSHYATTELLTARIVNIFILSAIALIITYTFFPSGWYRIIAATGLCFIPIFGYFITLVHEEPLALLFASIFLLILSKKDLQAKWLTIAAINLSLATAIRPYYALYGLMLAVFAFHKEGKLIFKKPIYYIAAIITIIPALFWYSWTQKLVKQGADTVAIFSERVFLSSVLNANNWHEFINNIVNTQLGRNISVLLILIYAVFIFLYFRKKLKIDLISLTYLQAGIIINLILLPLLFDSSVRHGYYSFAISQIMVVSAFICLYHIIQEINSRKMQSLLFICALLFVCLNGYLISLKRFKTTMEQMLEPLGDIFMGDMADQFFQKDDKVILLGTGGPQAYGVSGRNGRRDAGTFSNITFNNSRNFESYLMDYYGPPSSYQGLIVCQALVNKAENFELCEHFFSTGNSNVKTLYTTQFQNEKCLIYSFN